MVLDQWRIICASFLSRYELDPFLRRIVTGHAKWALYVSPVRRRLWLSSEEPLVPTLWLSPTIKKAFVCVWWNFLESYTRNVVRVTMYCEQLKRASDTRDDIKTVCFGQQQSKDPSIRLRETSRWKKRPHTGKIRQLGLELLPHPHYLSNLRPWDYHVFRSLEHTWRGRMFNKVREVKTHLYIYIFWLRSAALNPQSLTR